MTANRVLRRIAIALAMVVLAVLATVLLRGASTRADADDDATVTPLSSPEPDPAEPLTPLPESRIEPELLDDLEHSLTETLGASAVIEADTGNTGTTGTTGTNTDIAGVGKAFQSELEAERLEFTAEGWTREGEFSISDVELISAEPTGKPDSALIAVCVDASDLVVRRADGEVLMGDAPPPATNYFALERGADGWDVVGRSFPDDARCGRG